MPIWIRIFSIIFICLPVHSRIENISFSKDNILVSRSINENGTIVELPISSNDLSSNRSNPEFLELWSEFVGITEKSSEKVLNIFINKNIQQIPFNYYNEITSAFLVSETFNYLKNPFQDIQNPCSNYTNAQFIAASTTPLGFIKLITPNNVASVYKNESKQFKMEVIYKNRPVEARWLLFNVTDPGIAKVDPWLRVPFDSINVKGLDLGLTEVSAVYQLDTNLKGIFYVSVANKITAKTSMVKSIELCTYLIQVNGSYFCKIKLLDLNKTEIEPRDVLWSMSSNSAGSYALDYIDARHPYITQSGPEVSDGFRLTSQDPCNDTKVTVIVQVNQIPPLIKSQQYTLLKSNAQCRSPILNNMKDNQSESE